MDRLSARGLPEVWRRYRRKSAAPIRLYLHIGMHKAGSSAIQKTLALRERALRRHGLLYPRTGRVASQAHHLISHALGFSQGTPPSIKFRSQLKDLGPKLEHEARKSGCHTLLVSSEVFTNRGDIAKVQEFFSGFDTYVLIYLRRHDHWWASCYSQGVKTVANPPWSAGFDNYMAYQRRHPHKGNYRGLVDRWAAVFGASRLIVRPYESGQNKPSIVADVLDSTGFAELGREIGAQVGVYNRSLGEREIAVIDAIQHAELDKGLRKRLVKAIIARPTQSKNNGYVSPALRLQLIEENLADYRYIAETYLQRGDGKLFYEPLPEQDASWRPPAPASLGEIIEAVEEVLARQTGRRWHKWTASQAARIPWEKP